MPVPFYFFFYFPLQLCPISVAFNPHNSQSFGIKHETL